MCTPELAHHLVVKIEHVAEHCAEQRRLSRSDLADDADELGFTYFKTEALQLHVIIGTGLSDGLHLVRLQDRVSLVEALALSPVDAEVDLGRIAGLFGLFWVVGDCSLGGLVGVDAGFGVLIVAVFGLLLAAPREVGLLDEDVHVGVLELFGVIFDQVLVHLGAQKEFLDTLDRHHERHKYSKKVGNPCHWFVQKVKYLKAREASAKTHCVSI
mmetsp:Transcript_41881/g.48432  ORF Transcript_41881/g.48432 Transcript_41881/m.48432 type:complete len:213 (-) Transcript_41881:664-1302(-)